MKKLCIFLFLLIATIQSNAQYLSVAKNFSPTNMWNGYFSIFFNGSQFTLLGKCSWKQNHFSPQPFIACFSEQGDSLGFYQLKDTIKDEFWGFQNTSYRYNPVFPVYCFYNYFDDSLKRISSLYKNDSSLAFHLVETFQDSIDWCINVTFETNDHKLIGCGWKNGTIDSYINIIKTDKNGSILWERNILNTAFSCNLTDGFPLFNNNIVVSGHNSGLPVILCLDSSGNTLWQKNFGANCIMGGSEPMADSTIMVTCDTLVSPNFYALKLSKLNPVNGNVLWDTVYHLGNISSVTGALRVTSKGECIIAGDINSFSEAYYLKINANHQVEFLHKSPPSPSHIMMRIDDVIEYKDGGIAGCGGYVAPPSYYSWFFTTDRFGCIIPDCTSSVEENQKSLIVKELTISPNPAKGNVTISSTQPYSNASLLLYSMDGRLSETYPWPGRESSMQIDVRRFPRGTYQLILITNTPNKEVGKLVVE